MKWRAESALPAMILLAALAGCRQKMADQPAYRPLQASEFFPDHRSARPLVAGTVARGHLRTDDATFTGRVGKDFVDRFPRPVSRSVLERGRERYDIFCSPCHDRLGNGLGMVVRRGFPQPPSLHLDRLREAKPGYFFDVVTRGFGRMPEYASQIPVEDRWAIVAYVKALQLSQHARPEDVPPERRRELETAKEESR